MTDQLVHVSQSVLNFSPLLRVRRNHGLEHATLHVLADRFPKVPFAGHSDLFGFWIVGDVSSEDLYAAVLEALNRLRNGEEGLAVHPNCGTNYVAAGLLSGFAVWVSMLGTGRPLKEKLERLPLALVVATLALMVSQPAGQLLQSHVTTSGQPGKMRVIQISTSYSGKVKAHRVVTEG